MAMSTLGPIIFANKTIAAINFLKSKGLLASSMNCTTCGVPMNWVLVLVRMGGVGGALTVRHTRPSELDHSLVSQIEPSQVDTLDAPMEHQYASHYCLQGG